VSSKELVQRRCKKVRVMDKAMGNKAIRVNKLE